jgi:predicted transcriptional regulator
MERTLFDSERKVMEVIWKEGDITAKQISLILHGSTGWSKNTTYTVIKKCIQKGFIERLEPNFICRALLSKEQAIQDDTREFVNRVFQGSVPMLFSALLSQKSLSKEELEELKQMINKMEYAYEPIANEPFGFLSDSGCHRFSEVFFFQNAQNRFFVSLDACLV